MTEMTASRDFVPAISEVPFNNLALQWDEIAAELRDDLEEIFRTSAFSLGPQVDAFEQELAASLGVEYAVGLNSGTSALHLAMLVSGIGRGDEVLVPAHTFIATAWGVVYAGDIPVMVDVDKHSGTIDVADAERRLTSRTKAIIPVHLYGQPAGMAAVSSFAKAHGLALIEDNAQAIGARWQGRALGTIGSMGCLSFYPGKNLGAAGEAGAVVTNDAEAARRLKSLRNHGQTERYIHDEVGFNYRLDGIQGAVLRRKLPRLGGWTDQRRRFAAVYSAELADLPIDLPEVVHGDHVFHLYVVRSKERDALRQHLANRGVATGLHYPVPLHRQPCLASYAGDMSSYPQSDAWAAECLSLPLFVGMTDTQQDQTIAAVRGYFGRG